MAMHLEMLRSGSSGNCSVLTVGATRLLIDAGIGPRVLAAELAVRGLAVADLSGAIFTHCHSDHLRPNTLALLAREGVPIYLNPGTWRMACRRGDNAGLEHAVAHAVRLFESARPFALRDIEITAFDVCHGHPGLDNPAGEPVGFTVTNGRDTLGYCTDVGHVTPDMLEALRLADLLVLESNHDLEMERLGPRPWATKQWIMGDAGHLSNGQAAIALATLFANREGGAVILAHLSEACNTVGLARETVREALRDLADVQVDVARRHQPTRPWVLERGIARPAVADGVFA